VNCLNIIYRYILIYVENIHNYFHDFRRPVKYATMKINIARRKWSEFETPPNASVQSATTKPTKNEVHPACKWAAGWVRGGWRGEGSE
jgi:hypothetical protein